MHDRNEYRGQAMYAVIKSGGKQHRVTEGQTLKLETLNVEPGKGVDFEEVLMVSDGDRHEVGAPYVKGAKVIAEVLDQGRAKKINIIKFKRRKHHMKRMGHRQNYTEVKITDIKMGGAKETTKKKKETPVSA